MNETQSTLVKTTSEIFKLRRAGELSSRLHVLAMTGAVNGRTEQELLETVEGLKSSAGALSWAYAPIVGSGDRTTILHAQPTQRVVKDKELVLMDLGLKYEGYCSDITRTWPAGKEFSKEQGEIYRLVLKAQKEVINLVQPGVSLDLLHEHCLKVLADGLLSKGVIQSAAELEKYFPHKTSHWIGREVHDSCPYQYLDQSPVILSPNMCFTVEPGLYFNDSNSKLAGIGVRIEDVILVTEEGSEIISSVPKEVEEIETIRNLANSNH